MILNCCSDTVSKEIGQDLDPNSAAYKYWRSLAENPKAAKRLIGEVAFQLDRRILTHIFGGHDSNMRRKRFYGYIIKNIPEMILRESIDPATGKYCNRE